MGLCPHCIIKREKGGYVQGEFLHLCPKCNREIEWIGASNLIEPFWKRLPKFFSYPFSLHPLILIISLSTAGLIGLKLSQALVLNLGLTGLLLSIAIFGILVGILLKYSYEALNASARGDLTPPQINSKTISDNFTQIFKQIMMFIIISVVIGFISYKVGVIFGNILFFFFKLFIYSMIILLVTTNSLIYALNPFAFVRLTFRIGWGYLLMYLFLFILGDAPFYVFLFLIRIIPQNIYVIIFCLFISSCYYTIIAYHLMGYVLLQYHEEIGYEIHYEDFKDPSLKTAEVRQEDPNETILKKANIMIQEGKLDEAVEFIRNQTEAGGITHLALSERYYNLLKMTKRKKELIKHSITHLHLLGQANQKMKTCQLYAKYLTVDKNFTPTAATLFKIGGWLNESGKIKAAIGTYNRLTKAYPDDTLVPKAYFRTAQIFNDRLMKPEKAKQILKTIMNKFPNHEITPKARAYLEHLG
jgi:tetratricopeptide (TPR) repeat protein